MVSEPWRKNLYAIFVAELVALTGFNFVNPFMPLYIQELGNYTNREAALWAGIATGCGGIAMFFSAPFWGIMADRSGRKPMLLRSQFASAVVLALVGVAPNVLSVIILRLMQGLLSGTLAAASALVAGSTPRNKMPLAMGILMVAMFAGQTIGPLFGDSWQMSLVTKRLFSLPVYCSWRVVLSCFSSSKRNSNPITMARSHP